MITDTYTRLVVAYGLIALMILGAAALVWWRARNTYERRAERARTRDADRRRQRDAAAAAAARNAETGEL